MNTMTSQAPNPASDRATQYHDCAEMLSNGALIGLGDGAMAALAKAKSGADVQLLSVNADMIRIVQPGRLEIVSEITRASRTVIFVSAQIKQDGHAVVTLTALYKTAASK